MTVIALGLCIFAYFFGAIPSGLIIGKLFYRTDIREHGSGNIGATNAYRTLGLVAGITVFIADFLKGFIPVMTASYVVGLYDPAYAPLICILTGVIAVLGHSYSVFLKFGGGKGMSTAAGFVTALWPQITLILLIIWILIIAVTRYVSLASITIAVLFPVMVVIFDPLTEYIILSILISAVVIYRHRSNIKRLIAGEELKMGKK